MMQNDDHVKQSQVMTLTGGEMLILGQDCGNGHELPWVIVKSGNVSLISSGLVVATCSEAPLGHEMKQAAV